MVAIPGRADPQNNTIVTPSRTKLNWGDIEHKLKESLKFEY